MLNQDIRSSSTISSDLYKNPNWFELLKDHVFAKSWQFICDVKTIANHRDIFPYRFLDSFIDEPLILINNHNSFQSYSNVCTHRGNLLIKNPGNYSQIQCGYHGRRFDLYGNFVHMPSTEGMLNFPCADDNLVKISNQKIGDLIFNSLNPIFDLNEIVNNISSKIQDYKLSDLNFHEDYSQDYLVQANWALYCDNYLEGFHIPFIHPGLNQEIDAHNYEIITGDYHVLQTAYAKKGGISFTNSNGVAAYYLWVFPNLMFNFYPWGLSLNLIKPIKPDLTKVSFRTYIAHENLYGLGAGSDLDKVEREDQNIVEQVQKGIQSRFYKQGRFSPSKETGVHAFHLMLEKLLKQTK